MSDFDLAIPVILSHEGTPTKFWVDDPKDRGGETVWGISALIIKAEGLKPADLGIGALGPTFWKVEPALWHKADTIRSMWAFPGCLKAVTQDDCKAIYRRLFWDRYGYGGIKDQRVATKVFDCAVNCGPRNGHAMAQAAAKLCGQTLVADGILGPKSIAALNACQPTAWLQKMVERMTAYYTAITVRDPTQLKWLPNWINTRAKWVG